MPGVGFFSVDEYRRLAALVPPDLRGGDEARRAWLDEFSTVMARESSRRAVAACEAAAEQGRQAAEAQLASAPPPAPYELDDESRLPIPAELRTPETISQRHRWLEGYRRVLENAWWERRRRHD
jgi:hypothetical protein